MQKTFILGLILITFISGCTAPETYELTNGEQQGT